MKRIRAGWELTKKSWAVLREHRRLMRFPIYGAFATIPLAIITLGPGLYLIEEGEIAPGAPLAVLGFYILAFVGIYFSVGLAATADKIFRGEEASVSDGLAVARGRLRQVAGWAFFSTVVGVIISAIEDQGGIFGAIVGRVLDIGWALVTFLAVPVIALEGTGPLETLKRSGTLFKSRWGQQVTGNIAIGGAVFLFGVLPAAALIGLGVLLWGTSGFGGALLVIVGAVILAVALLIQKALTGIFGVALYHYAAEGAVLGGFTEQELESAVKIKGGATPAQSSI
ncbi:MAG: DUF6159 family protein [Solirubrobacterales bacterium]